MRIIERRFVRFVPTEISTFTSSVEGLVPASGGGTEKFLRADGTWQIPTITLSSISGYEESVQDIVGAMFQNNTYITWAYDDTSGTMTPTDGANGYFFWSDINGYYGTSFPVASGGGGGGGGSSQGTGGNGGAGGPGYVIIECW